MKNRVFLIFFFANHFAAAQLDSTIRYEGRLTGPAITAAGGNLSNQTFRVSLFHPNCSAANALANPLNVVPWQNSTASISNGAFSLAVQFDSTTFASAMNHTNDFGVGCTTPFMRRQLKIEWVTQGEIFYVDLDDAPRAAMAAFANESKTTNRIANVNVLPTAPSSGQVLKFVGGSWAPAADDVGAADPTKLPLAGGTMTGPLDMGTQVISNAGNVAASSFSSRNFRFFDADVNYWTITSPSNIASNPILTLPPTLPAMSGQVLSSDTSGNLSWVSPGGGVSSVDISVPAYMSSVGGPITSTGTITLGFNNQAQKTVFAGPPTGSAPPSFRTLTISDIQSSITGSFLTGPACNVSQALTYSSATDTISCTNINVSSALGYTPVNQAGDTMSGPLILPTNGLFVGGSQLAITGGNVGIGTNTPNSSLDVNGAFTQRGMSVPGTAPAGQGRIYFDSSSNKFQISQAGAPYVDLVPNLTQFFANNGNSFGGAATLGTNGGDPLFFETNNVNRLTILSDGKVGIGTNSPGFNFVAGEAIFPSSFQSRFHGSLRLVNNMSPGSTTNFDLSNLDGSDSTAKAGIRFFSGPSSIPHAQISSFQGISGANQVGGLQFMTRNNGDADAIARVKIEPNGTLALNAGLARNLRVVTANDSILDSDTHIITNSASAITLTLPPAGQHQFREITVRNIGTAAVSVSPNVVPLSGGTPVSNLFPAGLPGKWVTLISNGTQWLIHMGN